MKIYALLTGRGNNTLKDKNVLECLGHPVLYYPAYAALNAKTIDKCFCSSDDDKILSEASKLEHIPIKRPEELAQPTSQHSDCIMHALNYIRQEHSQPDILVITLANNVTIKSEWIDECVSMMLNDMTLSAVVPIYEDNDHHPFRAKKIDSNGHLQMFEDNIQHPVSTNRQDLTPCYFLAHNFWVINVRKLIESGGVGQAPWSFMGDNIGYYIISESIDIHKRSDLLLAEEWLKLNFIID